MLDETPRPSSAPDLTQTQYSGGRHHLFSSRALPGCHSLAGLNFLDAEN
jgi:hypothetical protein